MTTGGLDAEALDAGGLEWLLGTARAEGPGLAVLAVTPCLRTSERTAGGVHWEVRSGTPARFHHISHATLGIVLALAAVGEAAGRPDLTGPAPRARARAFWGLEGPPRDSLPRS